MFHICLRFSIAFHEFNLFDQPPCCIIRAYSRPLLGVPFAPNLAARVLEKIFSLEMVKNYFCLGGAGKQNAFFSENLP